MPKFATPAFGAKTDIDAAKENGTINKYDILYLGDTQEIGWIDADDNTIISTSRTQAPIEVNGVTGLGVENGSTIAAGKSLDEIVKMLVQKSVPATYTKPTVSLVNNGGTASGTYEAGTTITPKLKAAFSKNDAGGLTELSIKQGSDIITTGATSPLIYEGEDFILGDSSVVFSAAADYTAASTKLDNLGNESTENQFDAGTVTSSNYTYAAARNAFYGTGVGSIPELTSDFVRGLTNKSIKPSQGKSFSLNVAVGQQYIVFAYPASLRDLNNVTYVEANDSNMAANFTQTLVNVADARGEENGLMSYKVYTYAMAVPAAATMTFTITI